VYFTGAVPVILQEFWPGSQIARQHEALTPPIE